MAVGDDDATESLPSGWSRRRFLTRSGTAAGSLALAGTAAGCMSGSDGGAGGANADDGSDVEPDLLDWDTVRAQFSLSTDYRCLNAWALGVSSQPVMRAVDGFRSMLDDRPWLAHQRGRAHERSARRAAAELIGGEGDDVALTGGRAQALGLVGAGLHLGRGDELVAVGPDYFTGETARLAARRSGADLVTVALFAEPTELSEVAAADLVARVAGQVGDATRAIVVPWVFSGTGLKFPVADLAEALVEVNAERDETDRVLLWVDASFGLGVETATVDDLGCDFLVSGMDHWMFGPRGTGFCWGRPAAWERFTPSTPSAAPLVTEGWLAGDPSPEVWTGMQATLPDATPEYRWAVPAAVDLRRSLGPQAVAEHIVAQADLLKVGLADIDGVTVVTPTEAELSSGLVCFRPDRRDPHDLVNELRVRFIITDVAPFAPELVRLGPSLVTSESDVDAVLESIRDKAEPA